MLTYFEVQERLENLTEFRNLYREYVGFTNRAGNVPAQIVREKMVPLTSMTVEALSDIGLGQMVTREAPAKGGKKVRINVIRAIFRDNIVHHFSLDAEEPLRLLDLGVYKYQHLLAIQRLQLFNPIFWLFQFGLFLARMPLLIFRKSGYDTSAVEESRVLRVYLVCFQLVYFYLLARWVGLIDWIWFDILGM